MAYTDVIEMASSQSLRSRVTACAAQEGITNPEAWSSSNMWRIAASPGWGSLWEYHRVNLNVNQNPDLGARTDVITDNAILAAVQALEV